jgi:predicted phage terminase large subunit-like protein
VLIVGNSATNASKTIKQIMGIVESNKWYQVLFGDRVPNFGTVRWSTEAATLQRSEEYPEATFESAGVGTNIIRRHYDLIIEDDTVAPTADEMSGDEMMPTMEQIKKAVGFHKLTVPLFVEFDTAERIVVLTRWCHFDVASYIKEYETDESLMHHFKVLDIPAEDENGVPAYKKFSRAALTSIKASMGTFMYYMLYLNKPQASELMKFRPEWTRYHDGNLDNMPDGNIMVTVDPADPPTGKKAQDSTAVVVCLRSQEGLYVLEVITGRFTEKEVIECAFNLAEKWGAHVIRIEADRYAHLIEAFIAEQNERDTFTMIDPVKTKGRKKEARIMKLAPIDESGMLFLGKGMKALENELYQFPLGAHDDAIDALAWQVPGMIRMEAPALEVKPPLNTHGQTVTVEHIIESTMPKVGWRKMFETVGVGGDRWG